MGLARDVHDLLARAGVMLEAKPFAMGVRIEHPQPLIDRIQYGRAAGHPALPAAAYKLAFTPDDQRGAFSFCMCPGSWIEHRERQLAAAGARGEPGRRATEHELAADQRDREPERRRQADERDRDQREDTDQEAEAAFGRLVDERADREGLDARFRRGIGLAAPSSRSSSSSRSRRGCSAAMVSRARSTSTRTP
jgi:hypothetical protein